jgi:hypothetical protein
MAESKVTAADCWVWGRWGWAGRPGFDCEVLNLSALHLPFRLIRDEGEDHVDCLAVVGYRQMNAGNAPNQFVSPDIDRRCHFWRTGLDNSQPVFPDYTARSDARQF